MAVYGHILCLGDSLTHGARDNYGRCYPMELSDMLWYEYGQKWICIEEGVNGEISSDILRRSISVMRKYPDATEVVLLCGTNDSKDTVNMPPDVFRKNIEGIIRIASTYDKEVLLCTIPDLQGFGAPDYSQDSKGRIYQFNSMIRDIADLNKNVKELIELKGIPGEYYADGVHFNNDGYKEIARRVMKAIQNKRHFKTKEHPAVNDVHTVTISTEPLIISVNEDDLNATDIEIHYFGDDAGE